MERRDLPLPGPLDLVRTLGPAPRDPCCRVQPDGLWRALRTEEGPATLHLRAGDTLAARAWGPGAGRALSRLEDLVGLVEKFRPVQHAEAIEYVHCTGLAGAVHRERNRELLIVAGRKG